MTATGRFQVGLMCPPDVDPVDITRIAVTAERDGFDFLACGEHLFFHTPASNAFITLAVAAGATERIRLLSALTVLPVYPAALAAKMAATLDRASGGRFELGVGVGGEYPPEFAAAGVPVTERGHRTDEALDLIQRLFTGEPVDFDGQFAQLDRLHLDPPPLQRPGPPVWVGGRQEPAMRRAARFADVWLPYLVTPRRMASSLQHVRELAAQHQRAPETIRGALFCWGCVDADGAWARRAATESMSATYQQDFSELAQALLPSGDVAAVTARLGEYVQAGAERLIFAPACPAEHRERVVSTFVSEVVPALRKGSDG